jgi:transposase
MRQALYPSGAKDDPRDADLLLDILLQHRNKLRRLSPDSEATRRVQNLVEERRKLVDEKTAQINRLTDHLKVYFPQMLDWFGRLDSELVCALLERWPALEELQKASPASLRAFLRKHRCRDRERIEQRIEAIRRALPAIQDGAVIEAKSAAVKVIVQLVRILIKGIADLDGKIEEAAAAHPDFFIFNSLPGAGPVMAPRLLAAFGSQRERYRSAREIQSCSGIAPVTESSGKRKWVHFRWPAQSFSGKAFMNGRVTPSSNRNGHELTTGNNAVRAIPTMRPCEPWLSNGSASYFVAGKTELPTMRTGTWRRLATAAPDWVPS